MAQKRERSINFTREEIDILIKLVEDNKHILENKKSDSVSWNQKLQCWKSIEVAFNCASGSTYRTCKNLRIKYEGIKRETRKKFAQIRAETSRTRGGPSAAPILTPSESKVKEMILLSVDGMESKFDCDSLPNSVEIIHSPNETAYHNDEPVCPEKRTLLDTQDDPQETITKWSQWNPTSLRSRKHPDLCKPKPFEKITDSKMELILLQKQMIVDESINNNLKWAFEEEERQRKRAFEEEERQHKREMWALEKKLLLKKINDN